ncbi:MAG: hypothetical protein EOP88_15755 [Verrucomicrobiaceae bacterium]|nr:MAG: hypothetical protein EOP88_15755 [Verrucomicrobiaceae bacterium]
MSRRLVVVPRFGQDGPMEPSPTDVRPLLPIIFWIIWFAILNGLVMIQLFAGGGIPKGGDQVGHPVVVLAIVSGLALVALAIRFVVIPQIGDVVKKLPAMIVGLALSEGIGIVGMFVVGKEFPDTKQALFVSAIVCILSFAPFYAKPSVSERRF